VTIIVGAGTTGDKVVAIHSIESVYDVVAIAAVEGVGSRSALDVIKVSATIGGVIAVAAHDFILTRTAEEGVYTPATI
jgi:hypothetical protein